MAKGAEIGQKRVQEHLPELEAVFAPARKRRRKRALSARS